MVEGGFIKENPELYEGLKEILAAFKILTNLYLKYIVTNKKEILPRVAERLNELRDKDVSLLNQFLEAII